MLHERRICVVCGRLEKTLRTMRVALPISAADFDCHLDVEAADDLTLR
jgi:hypothetical protein